MPVVAGGGGGLGLGGEGEGGLGLGEGGLGLGGGLQRTAASNRSSLGGVWWVPPNWFNQAMQLISTLLRP